MSKETGKATPGSDALKSGPAWLAAAASLLLPGAGQALNRQWLKALLWLSIPILLISIEFASSDWGRYLKLQGGDLPPEAYATAWLGRGGSEDASLGVSEQMESLGALFGAFNQEEAPGDEGGDPFAAAGDEGGDPFAAAGDEGGDPFAAAGDEGGDPFASAGDEGGDPFASAGDGADEEITGGYFDAVYLYPDYAEGGPRYVFRDFGGFFTRNLWGIITLGRLVIDAEYANTYIELFNKVSPWLSADNSIVLLGNGLISLAVLLVFAALWILGALDAYKTRVDSMKSGKVERFKDFWLRVWDSLYVYIVSAPAFIMILMFTVIPIFFTFLLSFTNYTYRIKLGARLIEWVGLDTFKLLALDPGWLSIFGQIFVWTAIWAFMSSFTVYAIGFLNAMVVESPLIKAKRVWRTIMILPWAMPALVSLMVFRNVFDKDGLMNQFLFASGLMEPVSNFLFKIGLAGQADAPIFWFQPIYNGSLARFVVVLVNLWLGAPYHMMMIIGVLATIPRELYEAAAIDGATGFQRFRYITLPMVLAATVPALIMTFSFNFNNFGAVYFLTGGGPSWDPSKVPDSMRLIGNAMPGQTDILISWIYKLSFTRDFEQYNVAAVYSIIIFMIVGAFAVFNMLKSKSFKEEAGE